MSNRSNRSGLASLLLAACCLGACYGDITSPGGGDDGPSDDDDDDDDVSGPLVVSPSQVTLEPGATQGFQATRSGADAAGVTWAVDGDGAITTAGVYTAPGAEGTYTIVATDAASGERAEATVTVAELVATTQTTGCMARDDWRATSFANAIASSACCGARRCALKARTTSPPCMSNGTP